MQKLMMASLGLLLGGCVVTQTPVANTAILTRTNIDTGKLGSLKKNSACVRSVLIFAWGEKSLLTTASTVGMGKISFVDNTNESFISPFIYNSSCTTVYGE